MKSSQIVTFVVDKELDIENHLIALNSYKRNRNRVFTQKENKDLETLSNLSIEEAKIEIQKTVETYYKNAEKLISLAKGINEEWVKIEKDFIEKLEKIHKFPFTHKAVKGVLSTATRFGYNMNNGWFATDSSRDKFACMDVAMHELMHFMFHKYYDEVCKKSDLTPGEMWDIKESSTVLLNLECGELLSHQEVGYPPHRELRAVIEKSWMQNKDFDKTLADAIEFVKNKRIA